MGKREALPFLLFFRVIIGVRIGYTRPARKFTRHSDDLLATDNFTSRERYP